MGQPRTRGEKGGIVVSVLVVVGVAISVFGAVSVLGGSLDRTYQGQGRAVRSIGPAGGGAERPEGVETRGLEPLSWDARMTDTGLEWAHPMRADLPMDLPESHSGE